MNKLILNLATLLLAMLVVGTVFAIWFGFDPMPLTAAAYVEVQQEMIRALNVKLPIMGAITILLTLGSAYLARANRPAFTVLLVAAGCFIVMGGVTRFLNQPINAIVIDWLPSSPPPSWTTLRDDWWGYHTIRVVAGLIGFTSLVLGIQLQHQPPKTRGPA